MIDKAQALTAKYQRPFASSPTGERMYSLTSKHPTLWELPEPGVYRLRTYIPGEPRTPWRTTTINVIEGWKWARIEANRSSMWGEHYQGPLQLLVDDTNKANGRNRSQLGASFVRLVTPIDGAGRMLTALRLLIAMHDRTDARASHEHHR